MRRVEFTRRCAVSVAVAGCLVVTASGSGQGAVPGTDTGTDTGTVSETVEVEVERLYREASAATKAHERVRRAVQRGRREVERLRTAEAVEARRLGRLHAAAGELARRQYRVGGGGLGYTVRLLVADSPEQLMTRVSLARRGGYASASLMTRVRDSQARLARGRAESVRVLGVLKGDLARQAAAREQIGRKLARAQERSRAAELARRAAFAAYRVTGGSPGPVCGSGAGVTPFGSPAPVPAGRAGGARWVGPVDPAPMSSGYAESGARWRHRHTGQDFAVSEGTAVRAVGDGTVHFTGCGDGFGNQVIVRHANGYFTQYAHLSATMVRTGQRVAAGETLGLSGHTGNASGPHLHFEVRVTPQLGSGINPLPWLREHGVSL